MEIIDVSNPNAPSDFGHAPSAFTVYSVATANGLVYAAQYASVSSQSGFYVFSPSGSSLTLLGQTTSASSTGYNMLVSGTKAYIAGGASGFEIVDVSNSHGPSLISAFIDSGVFRQYNSVAVTGNSMAACGYPEGTLTGFNSIVNVSNPSSLSFAANPNTGGSMVLANNGLAYVLAGNINFIYDISTPSSPQLQSAFANTAVPGVSMSLVGNTLYVVGLSGSSQPHFAAINVSTPSSPTISGTKDFTEYPSGSIACSVAAVGNRALVGIQPNGGSNAVVVLDISNVAAPVELGTYANFKSYPRGVQLSSDGNYGYVFSGNPSILYVLNISQPSTPVLVTNLTVDSSGVTDLKIRGYELYATTYSGLYVFDISNPSAPLLTRSYSVLSETQAIGISSDSASQASYIYLATLDGGIVVLNEEDIQAPQAYITNPVLGSVWTNSTSILNFGGGSSDNVGVTAITWSNDRGGVGVVAPPLNNWLVNGIALLPGTNNITVNAFDAAGNVGSDVIKVIYNPPLQSQTIDFPQISDHVFGDPLIQLAAAASSGLSVTFSVISGPATLTSSNVLALTGAGAVTVEADQTGNGSFSSATPVDMNFNVARANQSVVLPPISPHLASDAPFALTATSSSGLPVVFSILSGPATVNSTNLVTLLGSGTVSISAGQPGNSNYNAAATVHGSFAVAGSPQYITFDPLSPQQYGDAPFPISATASSGLPVNFSLLSGPAQLSGNIVTLTNWGSVVIRASQPGNNLYAAASNVDQSLLVAAPDTNHPTITIVSPLPNMRLSNAVVTVSGTAKDNVHVASVWCSINNGSWNYATGTTNWTNSLAYMPGTNVLRAYSMDTSNNRSVTNTVSFFGVVNTLLTVRTNGLGSIKPNYNNNLLAIGQVYSLTAKPSKGFVFTSWAGTVDGVTMLATNKTVLSFIMQSNLVLTATFTDVTMPVLKVNKLASKQTINPVLISGTTSDNWQVANVLMQLNGVWTNAATVNQWKNWSTSLNLIPGTNKLVIYAVDTAGNCSKTNSRVLTFTPAAAAAVKVAGTVNDNTLAITDWAYTSTNGFSLALQSLSGQTGRIQFSTDLISWETLTNFNGTNALLNFNDPAAVSSSQRFYRAVMP